MYALLNQFVPENFAILMCEFMREVTLSLDFSSIKYNPAARKIIYDETDFARIFALILKLN